MIEVMTFGNGIDLEIQSVELITNKHYQDFSFFNEANVRS
jgi:hypothetical protein